MGLSDKVVVEYKRRFDANDRRRFKRKGIKPNQALAYNERFESHQIGHLFSEGILPEVANKYEQFDGWLVLSLVKHGISPEDAQRYPKRFDRWAIYYLVQEGISGFQASQYSSRFSHKNIIELVRAGCKPEAANKYSERFSAEDISRLYGSNISNKVAMKYPLKFSSWDIAYFLSEDPPIPPDRANGYSKRFDARDISQLVRDNISGKVASRFKKSFQVYDMNEILKVGCSPEVANRYNNELKRGIPELFLINCMPEIANLYDFSTARLLYGDLAELVQDFHIQGYKPALVNKFSKRFNGFDISILLEAGVSPEFANSSIKDLSSEEKIDCEHIIEDAKDKNSIMQLKDPSNPTKYDKRFSPKNISTIVRARCPPDLANKFDFNKFSADEITELITASVESDNMTKYPANLSKREIFYLARSGRTPKLLRKYDKRFSIGDVINLSCGPQSANKYHKKLNAREISILYDIGIRPEKTSKKEQKRIIRLLFPKDQGSPLHQRQFLGGHSFRKRNHEVIGTGSSGIVLVLEHGNRKTAWKIGEDLTHEYKLLVAVRNRHKNPKNVVKIRQKYRPKLRMFEMDYAGNMNLEQLIKKSPIEPETALKYAVGIMHGLIELRYSGIMYHRDLRPANILVDKYKKTATIVDLGIATTDRNAFPTKNRRFGGPNDLVSLGQILYYMVTGKHIFDKSQSMSLTLAADDINDYRTEVYSDSTGAQLKEHLGIVEAEIKDENMKVLIKECLTAKRYDYKRIYRLFQQISNSSVN